MNSAAQAWLERFLAQLRNERQLSAHTLDAYRRDLGEFVAYCIKHELQDWPQIDHQHVRSFAAAEHRRGINPRSIQRRLSTLRSFYRYLLQERQVRANPAVDVRAPKTSKHLPVTLDPDRMARLLQFSAASPLDKRDQAMLELFYSSGLRLQELASLNYAQVDMSDRTVRVRGKGNKDRIVPIGRQALAALTAWWLERALLPLPDDAAFVTLQGKRLTPRAIQKRVETWAKKQGLGQHVHPHMFRHSFASHILESSQDLRGVQELLGHANIGTTQVYTHLDFQHLAKIYDATHPRAGKKKVEKV